MIGLQPGLRQWLLQAKPGAELSKVSIAGRRGDMLRAEGRLLGMRFLPIRAFPRRRWHGG